jgi:O-antigen/teichoic acid export membrane protein
MYPEYFSMPDVRLEKADKRKLIRDIACLTVYTLSGVVINSTDSIFISAFVGTVEVAIIGNFTMIVSSVRTCVQQVYGAAKPSIGNLAATSSTEKQEQVFRRMDFICFWCTSFCTACLYTLMNPFVGDIWLAESYKISMVIIATLSVNFYIGAMVYPVESFRTANGLFVQGWYRPAVMAVLNIILDFVMGSRWGITGIFLATTISRVATQVWFDAYLVYKKVFGKKPWEYYGIYLAQVLMTVLSCVLCSYLAGLIRIENSIIRFGLQMVVAVVVPNVVIVLFNHRRPEFTYAMNLFKKLFSKLTKKFA